MNLKFPDLEEDCQAKKIPAILLCWRKLVWRSHEQNPSLEALESQEEESSKKIPAFILGLVWENTASIGVMTRIPARGAEIARKNPQENKKIEPSIENEANEANAYRPGGAEIARKNPSKNL